MDKFCAHARPLNIALALTMYATACRICEARRIQWPDIDFKRQRNRIHDTKTKKERFANMPQRLLVALANLPRDRKPFYWSESQLRRLWDEDVEAAVKADSGFARLTFHSARHGFATKMLRDGVDPKTAATLGGWDDITLFMETYAHAIGDKRATNRIFDTQVTREEESHEQDQVVRKK
jgi:integrase